MIRPGWPRFAFALGVFLLLAAVNYFVPGHSVHWIQLPAFAANALIVTYVVLGTQWLFERRASLTAQQRIDADLLAFYRKEDVVKRAHISVLTKALHEALGHDGTRVGADGEVRKPTDRTLS